jgi:hypothetical protein
VFIPALVEPANSKMKMTRAQALLVLEEEDGATADEIKQAYKKLALKWYTLLSTSLFHSSPSPFLGFSCCCSLKLTFLTQTTTL